MALVLVGVVALLAGSLWLRGRSGDTGTSAAPARLTLSLGGRMATPAMAVDGSEGAAQLPEYRYAGTPPDLGASSAVYRLTARPLTAADVATMAATLGLTAPPSVSGDGWVVSDGHSTLVISKQNGPWAVEYGQYGSAGATTSTTAPGQSSDGGNVSSPPGDQTSPSDPTGGPTRCEAMPPSDPANAPSVPRCVEPDAPSPPPLLPVGPTNLPSAGDAEAAARRVVAAFGVGDDVPAEVTDSSAAVAVACASDSVCPDVDGSGIVTGRLVTFSPPVDGLAAGGLEWRVEIGDDAKIVHLNGIMATPERLAGDYDLKPVREVFAALQVGDAVDVGPLRFNVGGSLGTTTVESSPSVGGPATVPGGAAPPMSTPAYPAPAPAPTAPTGAGDPSVPTPSVPTPTEAPGAPGAPVPATAPASEGLDPHTTGPDPADPGPSTVQPIGPSGSVGPAGPGNESTGPATGPVEPPAPGEPTPPCCKDAPRTVITITTTTRGWQAVPGRDDTGAVVYLVPTYVFTGTLNSGDQSSDFSRTVLAIDPTLFTLADEPQVAPAIGVGPTTNFGDGSTGNGGGDSGTPPRSSTAPPPSTASAPSTTSTVAR